MKLGILCTELYKVLAASSYGYNITMFDSECAGTINPAEAKWFYVKPVNFMIQAPDSIGDIGDEKPEVYLWKSTEIQDVQTKEVLQRLKSTSNKLGYGFTVLDFGNGNLPKKFSHLAMRNTEETKVNESIELQEGLSGSSRRSYFQLPQARMVIVHNDKVNEEIKGSRSRNVKEIFVECNGERIRVMNNIHAAKALTRHLDNGGKMGDRFWNNIEMYHNDLESLKKLLPELELSSRNIQSRKAMDHIRNINEYLKMAGTPRGYRNINDNIKSVPRIGNSYIQNYSKRLGSFADDSSVLGYARQHLMSECSKIAQYIGTIQENLTSEYDQKMINNAAKLLCLGALPNSGGFDLSSSDNEDKVLMYGDRLVKTISEPVIQEVLENICSKPEIQPNDALLILAVINSVLDLRSKKIPLQPEENDLNDWINGE